MISYIQIKSQKYNKQLRVRAGTKRVEYKSNYNYKKSHLITARQSY